MMTNDMNTTEEIKAMITDTKDITNSDDVIDVRDVIARVEHLEQLRQPGPVDLGEDNDTDQDVLFEELATLESLLTELAGNGGDEEWRGDWYPVTLIRESYATDYAQETAEDIGAIDKSANWPNNCIDWERATEEFLMDYTSVEFDGITYYYR